MKDRLDQEAKQSKYTPWPETTRRAVTETRKRIQSKAKGWAPSRRIWMQGCLLCRTSSRQPVLQKPSLKTLKNQNSKGSNNISKTKITEDFIIFMCVLPEYMESDNLKLKLQMVMTHHLVFGIEPGCSRGF